MIANSILAFLPFLIFLPFLPSPPPFLPIFTISIFSPPFICLPCVSVRSGEMTALQPTRIRENTERAMSACVRLGVPRLIEPNDMVACTVPDRLAVLTTLHQLRYHLELHPSENGDLDVPVEVAVPSEGKSGDDSGAENTPFEVHTAALFGVQYRLGERVDPHFVRGN